MNRFHAMALLFVLLAVPFAAVASGDHDHDAVTVEGEVLDMACYIAHEAKGDGHAKCASMCVKGGQPMGLLASDGTVYLLYAGHDDSSAFDRTKEFAGKNVEISGKAAAKAGIKGIEVQAVKAI